MRLRMMTCDEAHERVVEGPLVHSMPRIFGAQEKLPFLFFNFFV